MVIHTLAVSMLILHVVFKYILKLVPLIFIILTLALIIYINWDLISVCYNRISQEFSLYQQGNDKTLLGARFTMWRVGVMAFINAHLGETQAFRNKKWCILKKQNSDTLRYLDVHLHNEVIQVGSLFGIFGIYILFFITR